MNDTVVEQSIKHGRTMHIIGLEHALNMLEIGGTDVIDVLRAKVEREKKELADMEHSRYNADHYKNCTPCYDDHLDFQDEMRMDAEADAADHQSEED